MYAIYQVTPEGQYLYHRDKYGSAFIYANKDACQSRANGEMDLVENKVVVDVVGLNESFPAGAAK